MQPDVRRLVVAAQDAATSPSELGSLLRTLLAHDDVVGVAVVFDILAREPRIKPSRGLVIDPDDDARRRWGQRVAATAALLGSPARARVELELADELRDQPELARDAGALSERCGATVR